MAKKKQPRANGMVVERVFGTDKRVDGYPEVRGGMTERVAEIKDAQGNSKFRQEGVLAPAGWSDLAVNVVASKYFWGDAEKGEREHDVRALVHRVARTIADEGKERGYFATEQDGERFYEELFGLCVDQYGAFNSPVWFNVGLSKVYGVEGSKHHFRWDDAAGDVVPCEDTYRYPQGSACYIRSVHDSMESIMDLAKSEALLFKYGSGVGEDLSPLRSTREKLTGGGRPSGPVSFFAMFDSVAKVIKSGGRTRRSARLNCLKDRHPDILEFIQCKAREELKVKALIEAGFSSHFDDYDGAYGPARYQSTNISVSATDAFMLAAEAGEPWQTLAVLTGKPEGMPVYDASFLLDEVARGTWLCGDPGMQFYDTTNKWHTCKASGNINASNPCAEYNFIDESACNLASLNLMKFRTPEGGFDAARFRAACRVLITAQEILVDACSYPAEAIARNSHRFRPLGLGFANLGGLLMSLGIPYDSPEGRAIASGVTALMTGEAYLQSARHAAKLGPFDGFAENRAHMLEVMGMHRDAAHAIETHLNPLAAYLQVVARGVWDECLAAGKKHGYRNAQATLLAPTGTIAFLMDCDTTGIEPELGLVKYKSLAGGGHLKLTNRLVPMALRTLGYDADQVDAITGHIDANDTIEGAPGLEERDLPVFDCSFPPAGGGRSIGWRGHVDMMAAIQPFISGSSSKTINAPADSTPQDIRGMYLYAWRSGVKCVAIYRDGSKGHQPLSTSKGGDKGVDKAAAPATPPAAPATPTRERLPQTRDAVNHKFEVGGHEGYVSLGFYPDGRPGEIFLHMSKEGSTTRGLTDALATAVSIGLQYGVPIDAFVEKFTHTRFEPSGFTGNRDVPHAFSVLDYLGRWLSGFLGSRKAPQEPQEGPQEARGEAGAAAPAEATARPAQARRGVATGPPCQVCGAITVPTGSCHSCPSCGTPGSCG